MKLMELKRTLKQQLNRNDLKSVAELAQQDRRVITILVSFSYDKETELSWRAIKGAGAAAKVLLDNDYEFLRDTTRRLIWSVTEESGNVAWSSIEMLSEIISSDVERFSDLIPIVVSMYEEEIFREGVMYGLSRFADISVSLIAPYEDVIREALCDRNPLVRFLAIECALKSRVALPDDIRKRLSLDEEEVNIYTNAGFEKVKIRAKAIDI